MQKTEWRTLGEDLVFDDDNNDHHCGCSERKANTGLDCLQNLAVSRMLGVEMGVDLALLICATSTALESQFQAEEPSMTCMMPGCTGKPEYSLVIQFYHLHSKCPGPTTSSSSFPTVRRLLGGTLTAPWICSHSALPLMNSCIPGRNESPRLRLAGQELERIWSHWVPYHPFLHVHWNLEIVS